MKSFVLTYSTITEYTRASQIIHALGAIASSFRVYTAAPAQWVYCARKAIDYVHSPRAALPALRGLPPKAERERKGGAALNSAAPVPRAQSSVIVMRATPRFVHSCSLCSFSIGMYSQRMKFELWPEVDSTPRRSDSLYTGLG